MFSLQELLGEEQGNAAVDQISQNVGAEPTAVNSAIQAALPMLLNGLASNASTPQGAASLDNALAEHDGGILNNLGGLASSIFGGQQQAAPAPQVDGGGILGHIFGGSQDQVAEQVGNKTGLGSGQAAQIMMFLAPIVMGYLGRQKREQGVGAGGLGGLLGGLLGGSQQSAGGGLGAMATSYLDKDGDGSALDDIAGMAGGLFKK